MTQAPVGKKPVSFSNLLCTSLPWDRLQIDRRRAINVKDDAVGAGLNMFEYVSSISVCLRWILVI